MVTQFSEAQLRILIKESVKEGIESQFMKLRGFFLPFISRKEQKEIENSYKKPSRKIYRTYKVEI
ncbi:MAG: hypothetical protein HY001_02040 [Candidatus Portnoybacteria bacterium]|nr:hypothetical protein [Candidatus Portnoybacteria bacterium]